MKKSLLFIINTYQRLSTSWRLLGGVPLFTTTTCKFHPSCSEYAVLAIQTHGSLRGSAKAIGRVCRCNPWSAGGVDYPT